MEDFNEFYILKRGGEICIVCTTIGNNPMHGMGSWDLVSGPYPTIEIAEAIAYPDEAA